MDIDQRYPCVEDMKEGARRRVPRFAYDYLVGGIGKGDCLQRNRQDLDDTLLMPRYLIDASKPDFRCNVLGKTYDAPFGVAPIGLSGLIWRGSEKMLATAAKKHNIPYILSTFANESLERIRPVGGENAWFQFYPPNNRAMEDDIIKRTRNAGYEVMVVTIDIPVGTRRDHDIRNGLSIPPKIGLNTIRQCAARPTWSLQALIHGIPDFENMSPYYGAGATLEQSAQFVTNTMTGHITAERIKRIRDVWPGKMLVKGVLDLEDARGYLAQGADGLVISNHGGRQLDGAPSAASVLPHLRQQLGDDVLLMADGGVRTGLDIARMIALGANFVLMGRPFMYAVSALGARGADHVMTVLKEEFHMTMAQLGARSLGDLPGTLFQKD